MTPSDSNLDRLQAKTEIRKRIREWRNQLSFMEVQARSEIICRNALQLPQIRKATALGLYQPIDSEVDPSVLLHHAHRYSRRWNQRSMIRPFPWIARRLAAWASRMDQQTYLPVIQPSDRSMQWALYRHGDILRTGHHGIPVPADPRSLLDASSLDQLDALIIPLIAYDRQGGRLGYGGGYYDRLLAGFRQSHPPGHPPPVLIGLAFQLQEWPELPQADHDLILNYVVNETGILAFAKPDPGGPHLKQGPC